VTTTASTSERGRVPQEERTRAMRQRLLDATVECLTERGWSGTSTTLVSERAGVSRGAQLHHFPTKSALVLAAVEHLSEVRTAELRASAAGLPGGRRRTRAVLGVLVDHFTSPVFAAGKRWLCTFSTSGCLASKNFAPKSSDAIVGMWQPAQFCSALGG